MLLSEFINKGISALGSLYPKEESRGIILMLCEHFIGTKSYTHIVEPQYQIPDSSLHILESSLNRLAIGEPIQYVIGKTVFCDRTFKVSSGVLIPRPETELLAGEAVKIASRIQRMRRAYGQNASPVRVLDLCTGSGCLAWTIALSVPGVRVTGVDISDDALRIAKSQVFEEERSAKQAFAPQFIKADVLDTDNIPDIGTFDVIVSNPPYIMDSEKSAMRTNVLDFEPSIALFVPDDDPLVFYRAIAKWSDKLMNPDAKGITEINETLGKETFDVFMEMHFADCKLIKDFYDKNRFIFYAK